MLRRKSHVVLFALGTVLWVGLPGAYAYREVGGDPATNIDWAAAQTNEDVPVDPVVEEPIRPLFPDDTCTADLVGQDPRCGAVDLVIPSLTLVALLLAPGLAPAWRWRRPLESR